MLFVTNNSMLSTSGLAERLRNFGISLKDSELITSSFVTAQYIKLKGGSAFVIGEGIREELEEAGVEVVEEPKADFLVVGQDFKFNLEKLRAAYEALKNGAKFLTTARGRVYYIGKELWPATGVIVNCIEYMSRKRAKLLGKPADEMLETISLFVCSPRKRTVLIGDECDSDILTGKKLGYFTVLVRSGIDKEPARDIKPDFVMDSIGDLRNYLLDV